ncbi:MAG: hypothetical protein O6837_07625 [Deltaproteobacteria bacterium]|nr:hypothetical protein [Deltaproteobacteria bacterium]MCZ6562220.1 hypothetical protein [Deltaproteobacteria bacterium]MCZ6621113.1 hypothetical protein [Deltaproteobacteria bacterium]MCZ6905782.1 hypothetical protein [Deltaproteobacteria bacterium]
MEAEKALHTILVEMTTGMLVLSTLAIFALTWQVCFSKRTTGKYLDALDGVALFGASIGTVALIFAIITGYRQWPVEALMNGTLAKNKIFTGYMALGFWGAFLTVRLSASKSLWNRKGLSIFSMFLGFAGFLYIVFTASIGGTLAGKPSGFEELARTIVETRETFVLPIGVNVMLILLGIAAPLLVYFRFSKKKP